MKYLSDLESFKKIYKNFKTLGTLEKPKTFRKKRIV